MPTCPFWRASMKGVTPQLSLLSALYWHLEGRGEKTRTELLAAPKSSQQLGLKMEFRKDKPDLVF